MNTIFKFLTLFIFFSCNGQTTKNNTEHIQKTDTAKTTNIEIKKPTTKIVSLKELKFSEDTLKSYIFVKNDIRNIQNSLINTKLSSDTLSHIFKTVLVNRIIPYWENTTWSFEGHTSKPKIGEIACGYFVSTTLKDVGVTLNRYKLAQQSPINEAKSLALGTDVIEINEGSIDKNITQIYNVLKDGIHFIGFDQNHVGYILKEKGNLYLIHSNYIAGKVEIEQIEHSDAFASYSRFYIVELSTNSAFIENWLRKKEISIVK